MTNKFTKNIDYMDIAKGIGIILVVLGHCEAPFTNIIYLFHMALFFFISGYFYNDKYTDDFKALLIKRIKTLYIPFVKYGLLFLIFHNIFMKVNIYSSEVGYGDVVSNFYSKTEFIKNIFKNITFGATEQLLGAFWFLTVLFIVNILFCIISIVINKFSKTKKEVYRFIIIVICFCIGNMLSIKNIHLIRGIDISLVAMLVYYSGYLYKKYEEKITTSIYIFIICIIELFISKSFGTVSMAGNFYTNPIFFAVNTVCGIYAILYISKCLCKTNFKFKLLKYIGESTFIIMALHFISFKLINLMQIKVYNYPIYMLAKFPVISGQNGWWILFTLCGVLIPVIINISCTRFKVLLTKIWRSKNLKFYFPKRTQLK